MYDELIKSLRICANEKDCIGCKEATDLDEYGIDKFCVTGDTKMVNEAADAIEEMGAIIGMLKDTAKMFASEAPRWIPVTEKPPLKVGDDGYNGYLVYANGYYEVADYTTDKFDNAPYFHVDGEYEPDVTHYMPLPEPPKEEQTTMFYPQVPGITPTVISDKEGEG